MDKDMKLKAGDFVLYKNKNEIGVVKRHNTSGTGVFVWYHMGGTAANSPYDILEKIDSREILKQDKYSNEYALGSLMERAERIYLQDAPYDDLIDSDDIRVGIMELLFEYRG